MTAKRGQLHLPPSLAVFLRFDLTVQTIGFQLDQQAEPAHPEGPGAQKLAEGQRNNMCLRLRGMTLPLLAATWT